MVYELVFFADEPGKSKFPGLISLPLKCVESDKLFQSYWGANMIRPTKILSDKELNKFIEKSKEILLSLRTEFSNVIFIDFEIENELACDIDISHHNNISAKLIEPVLKNLEFSTVTYTENKKTENYMVSEISSIQDGIHAFSCTIKRGTFIEGHVPNGIKLFEETKIFASLAARGKL